MSEFAGNELLKTIRSAAVAYIDLHTAGMAANGADPAAIEEVIKEKTEEINKVLSCATECESAYQICLATPGETPATCAAQRTECLDGCL